jgi:hypothetical protein
MVAVDRSWYEAMEENRELARLARDPACARQRRIFGPVRVVTVLAVVVGLLGFYQVVDTHGLGAGLAVVWVLPMLVLGVVLAAEKLLLRFTR